MNSDVNCAPSWCSSIIVIINNCRQSCLFTKNIFKQTGAVLKKVLLEKEVFLIPTLSITPLRPTGLDKLIRNPMSFRNFKPHYIIFKVGGLNFLLRCSNYIGKLLFPHLGPGSTSILLVSRQFKSSGTPLSWTQVQTSFPTGKKCAAIFDAASHWNNIITNLVWKRSHYTQG